MPLRLLVPLLLAALVMVGCVPQSPAEAAGGGVAATGTPQSSSAPNLNPADQARSLLDAQFATTGWLESITAISFEAGLVRVSLDRPTATLGETEVFSRMCAALTSLIATEAKPSPVVGVQFFRGDGAAMVASGVANSRCSRFHK